MLYKNLTVKELYASIYDTRTIESFFLKGLEKDNDRLAVSAMEELILRGDTDMVARGLREAFERGDVKVKSTTATMIARSLSESCRGVDPFLHKFGKFLFKTEGPDPFRDFVESGVGRDAFYAKLNDSQKMSLKSDIQKSAEFDDTDAILRRFGKYLNLDDEQGDVEGVDTDAP
ncbi:hypothetical protein IKZ77_00365 [Candidatus Saccharibacteria bacterium]|nr:hypothetical protein [Candidatus Saccharibacteria bacterium]